MKIGTGIVRRVDDLGRIVLPKEMRKELNIDTKDPVEISKEGTEIVLRKYENRCTFCGKLKPAYNFNSKKICRECLEKIKNEL